MKGLYVERVLVLRPDRPAFQHVSGDELELNKLLVEELSGLLKQSQFNPNHDIDKVDLLQMAYGVCLQVYDNPLEIEDFKKTEWLTINDFLDTISIYSTSKEQSSMALCIAMHIHSLQREIKQEAYHFADIMKSYCAQTAFDSRLYRHFCSLRTKISKLYNIDWHSFNPTLNDLEKLPHYTWNTITHGFSMEIVERWLKSVEQKSRLLDTITSAFEEDVKQRKMTEEENENFNW